MHMIVLLQVALPLVLLTWLCTRPLSSTLGLVVQVLAIGVLISALAAAGLWLVLPRWLIAVYLVLFLFSGRRALNRRAGLSWPRRWEWLSVAVFTAVAAFAGVNLAEALAGRVPFPGTIVNLAPPLRGQGLLIANGGSTPAVNGHLMTLDANLPRFRPYRGQSFGVDIVRVKEFGRTSGGWRPADPAAYAMFGETVYAPCGGAVISVREDRPDMPVPVMDRSYLLGNHIVLACGDAHVVLAHFRRGGVEVAMAQTVAIGQVLGEVGNSGNTQEPHLHIHAQSPGTVDQPISGEPLPITIGGRYLVRNDRL